MLWWRRRACPKCEAMLGAVRAWRADRSAVPPMPEELAAAHGSLTHRALRGQEGGSYLYECGVCASWWVVHLWMCVGDLYVTRGRPGLVEKWGAA
jgi:hypothetical protein